VAEVIKKIVREAEERLESLNGISRQGSELPSSLSVGGRK